MPRHAAKARRRGRRGSRFFIINVFLACLAGGGMLVLAACAGRGRHDTGRAAESAAETFTYRRPLMGTLGRIVIAGGDEAEARAAADAAFERMAAIEAVLTDYRPESEAMRLVERPAGTWLDVGEDLARALDAALAVSRRTDGAFDVTVGPLVQRWREARATGRLPGRNELDEARARTGWRRVEFDRARRRVRLGVPGMRLDFGGIGKGYAMDEAAAVLRDRGVESFLIDVGGDVLVGAPPPGEAGWRVAVTARQPSTLLLRDRAVASSGDRYQAIEIGGTRYSHLVDPRTGLGVTEPRAATVVAPSATTADALASALAVMGPERGMALIESTPGVEAVLVFEREGRTREVASSGFGGILGIGQ